MSNLNTYYKFNNKTFINDFNKPFTRRIEILNLINSYKKNLIKEKTQLNNQIIKLPKLVQSNSHKDGLFFKKFNKNDFLNTKDKFDFSNLNFYLQNKNQTSRNNNLKNLKKITKTNKAYRNPNNNNKINTNTYRDINRIRIYKIKNLENNKGIEFKKANNEYCFIKKNYFSRKNKLNMDIFNLIKTNKLFFNQASTSRTTQNNDNNENNNDITK